MATSQRVDTRDIAALLAATDAEGRPNPLDFEAQRLVLRNRRVGGVDAAALVNDLQRSPALRANRDSFLDAVEKKLDTPAEKRRFAEALDAANITDTFVERQGERLAEATAGVRDEAAKRFKEADQALSDLLANGQQRLKGIANDPQRSATEQAAANAASYVLTGTQAQTGFARGAITHTADTLGDFVHLARMADRMVNDPSYRKMVVGMATMYAADVIDDPSKPKTDAQRAASDAMEKWDKGLKEAQARGKEAEYLGGAAGVIGVELVASFVPVTKLGKFGKAVHAIDAVLPEHAVELTKLGEVVRVVPHDIQVLGKADELGKGARTLTEDAGRIARTREQIRELGETLAEANRDLKQGGMAGRGASGMIEGLVERARDQGNLEQLIRAAHQTDNVEGLLRSGQLTPRELGEVAKLDKTVFEGKIKFQEALDHSLKGVDLTTLSRKHIGDIGEAIQTHKMVELGYTDIVSIKNKSGQGIDIVGRHPDTDRLEFFEVKTSVQGKAAAQNIDDPGEFIRVRLQRAIDGRGQWAEHRTIHGLPDIADKIMAEAFDPETKIFNAEASWVRINISNEPGSHKLRIDSHVSDPWVRPDRRAELSPGFDHLRASPDFQEIYKAIAADGRWDEQQSTSISAALLRAHVADPVAKHVDSVAIVTAPATGEVMVFAVYSPHGDRGPHFENRISAQQAVQEPAEKNFAQVEQINQQQALAQQEAQQRGPDDPSRGGPRTI